MPSEMEEFKDLFIQTSRDQIKNLNSHLLNLEKNSKDKQSIDEVFRAAHTLKGSAAMMKYDNLAFLCHTIEDIFFEIKNGTLDLTGELADILFSSFDTLKKSLDSIEQKNQEENVEEAIKKLKDLTGVKTEGLGKSVRSITSIQVTEEKTITPEGEKVQRSISVKVEYLDSMLDIMGELLVQKLRLKKLIEEAENDPIKQIFESMETKLDDMHYKMLKTRTVQIGLAFEVLPRAIRDLNRKLDKEIEFEIKGADLELDRTIVERLEEPLIHIIRNSADHGIEKKGKVVISAEREGDLAVIKIADDGKGIDWEKLAKKANTKTTDRAELTKYLFSGISTSDTVTQVSGRGVGLYAVKKMVEDCNGVIEVISEKNKGTTFILKFPITLAIIKTLLVAAGGQKYVIPVSLVERSVQIEDNEILRSADCEVFVLEEKEVPIIRLSDKFNLERDTKEKNTIVIVKTGMEKVGVLVGEVQEVVDVIIKPMPKSLRDTRVFVGTTILGDGKSVLILNPAGLV